jgi:hypothetical protein
VILIDCPACGNKTSSQASACPKCGQPIAASPPIVAPPNTVYVTTPPPQGASWLGSLVVLSILAGTVYFVATNTEIGTDLLSKSQQLLTQISKPSESSLIIGKWQFPNLPNTLEFFADGTLRETGSLKSVDSKYEILGNGRMRSTSPGLLYGTTENEWNIKFSSDGDSLTMTPNVLLGVPITLTRIKD